MDIITSKEAIQKTTNAIAAYVEQAIERLIPSINESIEAACANTRYQTAIDVTKHQHLEFLYERICARLEPLGYKCRLVDDYESGRSLLAISWGNQ